MSQLLIICCKLTSLQNEHPQSSSLTIIDWAQSYKHILHCTSLSPPRTSFLSSIRDICELGLELTLLAGAEGSLEAAADMDITEAHLEHWSTEERDLEQ